MAQKATVLLVDDQVETLELLKETLEATEMNVLTVDNGLDALNIISSEPVDLVFADYRMPLMNGLELLERLRRDYPEIPVIILTASDSIQIAVKAVKSGAFDYLNKPFDYRNIQIVAEKALAAARMWRENAQLKQQLRMAQGFGQLVGQSRPMRSLFGKMERACEIDASVLIQGENGTGKELIARAIHEGSLRREGPFVPVDCAAIPQTLMESELFGHEKGAFTGAERTRRGKFEQADGGTLLLDEIGEMDLEGQAKLLRALQERRFSRLGAEKPIEVNIRVIAATNKDLETEVRQGRFRQDLFYRLNVFFVEVPALRYRKEDIPLLAQHFIEKHTGPGQPVRHLTAEALRALVDFPWPGNVRQLENAIHSAVAMSRSEVIELENLPYRLVEQEPSPPVADSSHLSESTPGKSLPEMMRSFEKKMVAEALKASGGIEKEAASRLGISERSMWYLVKKHNLKKKS